MKLNASEIKQRVGTEGVSKFFRTAKTALALGLLLSAGQMEAKVLSWSGGGANGYWSNPANWGYAGTPNSGDTLIFPASQPRLYNTNDLGALVLSDIIFNGPGGGYYIFGNIFTLTNSIQATNTANINIIYNDIALATTNLTANVSYGISLMLAGDLSGAVGLTKTGAGGLWFIGNPPNTYTGTTLVRTGTLILDRNGFNNSFAGPLVVSDGSGTALVQLAQPLELPATALTVNQGGTLDLNGYEDVIGLMITLNGNGSITTESGILSLAPNATVAANPGFFEDNSISGNLEVPSGPCTLAVGFSFGNLTVGAQISGAGAINITGNGFTTFSASNSFTGPLNLLQSSTLTINNQFALGATNSPVTISNTAALDINGGGYLLRKPVIDASANTNGSFNLIEQGISFDWTGPVTLAGPVFIYANSNANLEIDGEIGGSGGIAVIGGGGLILGSDGNFYTGTTTVTPGNTLYMACSGLACNGNMVVGGTVNCWADNQLGPLSDLNIQFSGVFHMGTTEQECFSLNGFGTLDLGTDLMEVGEGGVGVGCEFDGAITNIGSLLLNYDQLVLTGDNSYTGTTFVESGLLYVDGYQPLSPIYVGSGGFLYGIGDVGSIYADGGSVSAGNDMGVLYSADVIMTNGATYIANLTGSTVGTGYNQLYPYNSTNIAIGGANLSVNPSFSPDDGPTNGQQFFIITNSTGHPIIGNFNGYPDGSIYTSWNGMQFKVNYGQNVVLTYTNPPTQQADLTVSSGNGNGFLQPNECANLYVRLGNPTQSAITGVYGVLRSLTPGVAITQPISSYPDVAPGQTVTNLAPFQVMTMPWLNCSTNINLLATFATATAGTFSIPLTYQLGAPLQFDNFSSLPIPDVGAVTSAIPVSGLSAPIAKVEVLLDINHSYDSDLAVDLVAPDQTTVHLLNHDGFNGQNFGSACGSAGTETIFDDGVSASISAGIAPFVGSFRPTSPLAALIGKTPAAVNNLKWNLQVSDTEPGNTGTLECWSLRIWPGACPAGGGICELCPSASIYGYLGTPDPVLDRLSRSGAASSCAVLSPFPGIYGETDSYDAYTFRNGPADACITVTLVAPGNDTFSAAYLGYFISTNVAGNYLADSGNSTFEVPGGAVVYSFSIPANAAFVVVVNGVGYSSGPYGLSVMGGSCQPVLHINPAGPKNVALSWTTAAGGYLLESTNRLNSGKTSGLWSSVTNTSVVIGSNFVVTNAASGTKQFYRLRKPEL